MQLTKVFHEAENDENSPCRLWSRYTLFSIYLFGWRVLLVLCRATLLQHLPVSFSS